jgi:hypothetical protein
MPRVSVTSEESAFIQERIDLFAKEVPEELRWQLPYVERHGALPLYIGWTETAAIRSDGEFVRWSTEEWENAMELHEPTWTKIALVLGARRYPELARLIPSRPGLARDCEVCEGSGRLPVADVICQCGGVGWVEYVAGNS